MSKEGIESEIKKYVGEAMEDVRNQMEDNYIHDVTLDFGQMAQGFILGAQRIAKKLGFDDAKIKSLHPYNNDKRWKQAIRNVNKTILSRTNVKPHNKAQLTKLKSVKGTNFIGVYVIKMNPIEIVLRFYNKQAGSPPNSSKFKTFNKNYRRWVWNEWFNINKFEGGKGIEKIPKKGDPQGIKGTLGSATPFAHETTVGMQALEEMGVSLEADQSLEAFDGVFIHDAHTLDLAQAVRDSLTVEWEDIDVYNHKTGMTEKHRIVKGKIVAQPRNLSNTQAEDWVNLKKGVLETVHDYLEHAEFMAKDQAADFEGSIPFRQQATRAAQYIILQDLMKKNGRYNKVFVKTKTTKPPKPKRRSGTVGKSKSGGGTRWGSSKIKEIGSATPRKGAEKGEGRDSSTNIATELARLKKYIQSRLPAEVRRNMGRPALQNRTGRFSNSVQLLNLTQAKATIMAKYTYLLSPYQTFENTGRRRWPMSYNPKTIIAKSIRNLALGRIEQKLTVRRV